MPFYAFISMINMMDSNRLLTHPIIDIKHGKEVRIYWQGTPLRAYENETVASALIANGFKIFGHHKKDHSPQGIFCANGQCAQCMAIIDGSLRKSCMELVRDGMQVSPAEELPELESYLPSDSLKKPIILKKQVLIIGGGPAGLAAAIELGERRLDVLLVDDKQALGGKLVLQTHRFFGSTKTVYAGTRGIEIAHMLAEDLHRFDCVESWTNSPAVGIFSDKKVGILKDSEDYILVEPELLLITTGAREKNLPFAGNTLPGVLGAGAFQTFVNRDLVLPARRIFVIGGGNVGLIAAYHALQAGIQVVGIAEVMRACGGYKVHKDKISRCGVPIFASHTVLSANGKECVESITIAEVDDAFIPKEHTEKTFTCDGILLSVGLEPADEFYKMALSFGMRAYAAGDAKEIAEASSAIYSGKISALEIVNCLEKEQALIPKQWVQMKEILASKPGTIIGEISPKIRTGVYPILHCVQQIPCDPCVSLCPLGLIRFDSSDIRDVPVFRVEKGDCVGCAKCLIGCPGLAITLVDYRKDPLFPTVTIPYEMPAAKIRPGVSVTAVDTLGAVIGIYQVTNIVLPKNSDRTQSLKFQVPADIAEKIAGIRTEGEYEARPIQPELKIKLNENVVCVCEKVTETEIRALVRSGIRDLNALKAASRAGMGACGGKTCEKLITCILMEEGVPEKEIIPFSKRPLFMEVPLRFFQQKEKGTEDQEE